jgi:hypothetical protein
MVTHGRCPSPPRHVFELWRTPLHAIRTHEIIRNWVADTPFSRAISWSRRLFSSSVTRVAPVRELVRPMLVPGRAPDCEAALDKGGAVGRSGASHNQRAIHVNYAKVRTRRVAETCRSPGPRSRMRERIDALTCRWHLRPYIRLLLNATIRFRASGWIGIPAVTCAINLRNLVDSKARCKLFWSV